jgi:MoxR-like ATPase
MIMETYGDLSAHEILNKVAAVAAKACVNVLLWGRPGSGKSWLARHLALLADQRVFPYALSDQTPAAEIRGHFIPSAPQGTLEYVFTPGPILQAYRCGGRVVFDEIDQGGSDTYPMLLAGLDSRATAGILIPHTGEIVRPAPGFSCWATTNADPKSLPPALLDRFPIRLHVDSPSDGAFEALPADLRDAARQTWEEHGFRAWLAVAQMREAGADFGLALRACFGDAAETLAEAISIAGAE